jgi:hypothetical protein
MDLDVVFAATVPVAHCVQHLINIILFVSASLAT